MPSALAKVLERNASSFTLLTLCAALPAVCAEDTPSAAEQTIEEVTVYGLAPNAATQSGSRLGLTLLETPATLDVISGDAIRRRMDTSVLQSATRSAGFTAEANPGNGGQSIAARGFRGQGSVTKLFNGTNYFTAAGTVTFPFDIWGIERIEILKGPASVMYGEGGIGGAINVVAKAPTRTFGGDARLSIGENNTQFLGLSLTGGLGEKTAARVDYSQSSSDNWVSNSESDAQMLSIALDVDVTDDLVLSLRLDDGEQNPMQYFGTPLVDGDFVKGLEFSNFNVGDAVVRYEDRSYRAGAKWRASDSLTVNAELYQLESQRYWRNAEFYTYALDTARVDRFDALELGHDMEHRGFRSNLVSKTQINGWQLTSSIGAEINRISFERPSNFGPANPDGLTFSESDTVDPANFNPGTLESVTGRAVPFLADTESDVDQFAFFAETQLKLTERLALVAGLRYDDVETDYLRIGREAFKQTSDALTGRLGMVFDITDTTATYAQYATGATHPSNSIVTARAANREADMIKSEQIELGIKHSGDRLGWNIAVFDIVKNDLIEDDPDSGDPNDLIFIPEQTSVGVELGVSYALTSGLRLYGNASFLKAETDEGVTPSYVPQETANLGFIWTPLSRLLLMADARYVGERFHPSRPIPSYTVIDTSLRWKFDNRASLALRLDNALDELYATSPYYSATWLVGQPRTVSLTADYSF